MRDFLIGNAWLVACFPLLGGLVAALGGRALGARAHLPVVAGIALAFLISLGLLAVSRGEPSQRVAFNWIEVTGLSVPIELRVDGLTTMMLAMVTFVATLVAVYASGYMAGDPGYARFFAVVGLFVFSMTGLVLSSNYLLTYAFWEGVGVCSYLLIGFYHAKPSAAAAAKKAFLVNRIGDVGFAIAIFWMWSVVPGHDLGYDNVLADSTLNALPGATILGIALLLFWAATAKSAQVPLYVWLPDAMEGPTPVSALIHAATMVTAGVYLVARSSPLIVRAPSAQLVIAVVGCITALLAAAIAVTQTDLKRVMAYSTVSQLGYMFMGLGAGVGGVAQLAVVAAMFHLFTHAFFKALLFLASGSVMHSMGGVIDMRRFGGLRHRMPITCATFAVGGLALSGIFPFAGFFSKDEILAALRLASHEANAPVGPGWGWAYGVIYWVAVAVALLTAFYTGRAFFMTFFGPEKLPGPDDPEAEPTDAESAAVSPDHADGHDAAHGHGHDDSHFGHESPPLMTYPLIALAVCAAAAGLVFGPTGWFERHVLHTPGLEHLPHVEHGTDWFSVVAGTVAGLLGLFASWRLYAEPSPIPGRLATRLAPLYRASLAKFRVDEVYQLFVVGPTRIMAQIAQFLDTYLVDGLVRGVSWLPRLLGRDVLAPYQNGLIQYYAAVTALSVAAFLAVLLLF